MNKKSSFVKLISVNPGERMNMTFFQIFQRTNEMLELKHKVDVKKRMEIRGDNLDCAESLSEPPKVKVKKIANGKEEDSQAYFYEWADNIMLIEA